MLCHPPNALAYQRRTKTDIARSEIRATEFSRRTRGSTGRTSPSQGCRNALRPPECCPLAPLPAKSPELTWTRCPVPRKTNRPRRVVVKGRGIDRCRLCTLSVNASWRSAWVQEATRAVRFGSFGRIRKPCAPILRRPDSPCRLPPARQLATRTAPGDQSSRTLHRSAMPWPVGFLRAARIVG